jgi:hypothetical protein
MTTLRTALACAAASLLAACALWTNLDTKLDPKPPDTIARQLDCTETGPDGSCNKKTCKSGPGGPAYYCDTYAYYCVKAGHKWEGTKDDGTCTRMHPD